MHYPLAGLMCAVSPSGETRGEPSGPPPTLNRKAFFMTEKTAARLESLRKRKAQLENRIADAERQAKVAARKLDARRKIIVGGAILAAIADSPGLAEMVKTVLAQRVTRALDRAAVADLLGDFGPAKTPPPEVSG